MLVVGTHSIRVATIIYTLFKEILKVDQVHSISLVFTLKALRKEASPEPVCLVFKLNIPDQTSTGKMPF